MLWINCRHKHGAARLAALTIDVNAAFCRVSSSSSTTTSSTTAAAAAASSSRLLDAVTQLSASVELAPVDARFAYNGTPVVLLSAGRLNATLLDRQVNLLVFDFQINNNIQFVFCIIIIVRHAAAVAAEWIDAIDARSRIGCHARSCSTVACVCRFGENWRVVNVLIVLENMFVCVFVCFFTAIYAVLTIVGAVQQVREKKQQENCFLNNSNVFICEKRIWDCKDVELP